MYRRILVPIDGSHTANRGVVEAIKLAKDQKAALRLLHVVDQAALVRYPQATLYGADLPKALEKQGQEILAKAGTIVRKQGLKVDTTFHRKLARVADVIIQHAKKRAGGHHRARNPRASCVVALIVLSWAAMPSLWSAPRRYLSC